MRLRFIHLPAIAIVAALSVQAQTPQTQTAPSAGKVGVIHIQNAIAGTKDGQKALQELQTKFTPKQKELEKKQNDIQQLREQFQKVANTASEDVRQKYAREIDQKTKSLQRDTEDAQADFDQEQQRLLQDISGKMMAVLDKYARDNTYTLIIDVSSPQTPVLFASNTIDVTTDIVGLYDKNAPTMTAPPPPPATGTAKPATPGSPAPSGAKPALPGQAPPATTTPAPKPAVQTPPPAPAKKP